MVLRMTPLYITWTCGSCVCIGNATFTEKQWFVRELFCNSLHRCVKVQCRLEPPGWSKWVHFFKISRLCSLKYCFCFLLEPQKIFLWFSYHHFLCIIYCMIRSGISYVEISLSFMVTWTYDWKRNVFTQTFISSCKAHLIVLHANPF